MPEGDLEAELWSFNIVAPGAIDGIVNFNLAIERSVGDQIRANDPKIWSVVMGEVDAQAREKIEDSLS